MSEIYHAVVTFSLDDGWGVDDFPPLDGAVWDPQADKWILDRDCSDGQRAALAAMRQCLDDMTDRANKRRAAGWGGERNE